MTGHTAHVNGLAATGGTPHGTMTNGLATHGGTPHGAATNGFAARIAQRRRIAFRDTLPSTWNAPRAPLVSVVIATYNGERFVAETLDSVLAQTWEHLEVIVCDDGSTDGTLDILAGYRDRVLVHRQKNRGVSAARNRGASFARGEYIAFLDHDDLWEPDMLERQVGLLLARKGHGLVYGDSWIIDTQGHSFGQRKSFLEYREGDVYGELLQGNFIPIETAVLPAAVFRALGGFDTRLRYLEDYELYLRVAERYPVAFQPHPVARYRIHERNLSHDKEALLKEWVAVLDGLLLVDTARPAEQRAIIERERARRCAEVAWQQLRRVDLAAADRWLERAGKHCPAGLRTRVTSCRKLFGVLPAPVARRLVAWMPRRRLYGL